MSLLTAYAVASFLALIVAAVFGYLGLIGRGESHYRFWAAAFLCQAVRQALNASGELGFGFAPPLAEGFNIATLGLTILGTLALVERAGRWRLILAGGAAAIGWLILAQFFRFGFFWQSLPIYALVGGGMVWTGFVLWRQDRLEPGTGLRVLAALLILWGGQIAFAAFLRPLQWYLPVGFVLNTALNVGIVLFLVITAQRRAELLNRRSEGQLRTLADNLPILVAYVDGSRRVRFINRTGETWYARPAAQIIGQPIDQLLPKAHVEANRSASQRATAGELMHFERTLPYPDGITRTVDVYFIPDIGERGAVRGVFAVVTDISERRATEGQLRQSQKMEAIGQLTGGVAHDFNNLLAVISGNLELLGDAVTDGDLREMVDRAATAVDRGVTLTRSLLAFARKQPLTPQPVDLGRVTREMTELLRRTVPESIEIELVDAGELWRCEADAGQLQNALLNLVLNARDAMPGGGKLTIETSNATLDAAYAETNPEVAVGQYVMLAVSDTGSGMALDVVARAFDPFFTTKRGGSGTGLGLSMVYGFIKQSGGHAKIYSEVGHGTTVKLYLPRSQAAAAAPAPVPTPAQEPPGRGETVLVVEDDDAVRRLALDLLKSLGYVAFSAVRARDALELLQAQPDIDLLLTDVMLPGGMNGRQLAEAACRQRPGLPVLYMSGYTENAVIHHGRLDPGVQLLQKPFRRRDLAFKLRAVLDGVAPIPD